MPSYDFLIEDNLDMSLLERKISALRSIGVPYEEGLEEKAEGLAIEQAKGIASNIISDLFKLEGAKKEAAIDNLSKKEVVAIIAYLQRLGTDIQVKERN